MLIGHLGALLSFITFFLSVMAYSYGKDATVIEPFEKKCLYTLLIASGINIISLVLKDYSVLYYADYIQFLASLCVFGMTISLSWIYLRLGKSNNSGKGM
ncbi:MAG: hypothetical protein K6C05_03690 [Anaerovibrio sp.]|uniref:hypothetical protein n=1 Tax=Anaerovibrio sp. TaxID=1872532 RepID=UPI0025EF4040|nr:hypothetical protein [Anaerovibrio sp.]MCR5175933.1 hypothetical protein [Anaerovibrio sp.]